jgi:hypothetical protein
MDLVPLTTEEDVINWLTVGILSMPDPVSANDARRIAQWLVLQQIIVPEGSRG